MEAPRAPAPARLLVLAAIVAAGCPLAGRAGAQPSSDVAAVIARAGDRVADYYRRAQRLVCVETATMQPIRRDWTTDGMPRTVVSELRVESEAPDGLPLADARIVRDVRRVNGRAPRAGDRTARTGCTDPNPLSSEPLAFLLPAHRGEYRFVDVRGGREDHRAALVVDFASAAGASRPELVEDPGGHDDCFDWAGPIATRGRLWVDAATYDVLRVDRWLPGPIELRVPRALQRRYGFASYLVLERDDVSMRYRQVRFSDPDELLLLPESIDAVTILRSELQSARRTTTFADYRRFLTTSRILKGR